MATVQELLDLTVRTGQAIETTSNLYKSVTKGRHPDITSNLHLAIAELEKAQTKLFRELGKAHYEFHQKNKPANNGGS